MRYDKKTVSKGQVAKIHALASKLGLIDGNDKSAYLEMLNSYGVSSSKELSFNLAGVIINKLESDATQMGRWTPQAPANNKKYQELDNRKDRATAAQLRAIEGIWNDVSYATNKTVALRTFVEKKFGISAIEWLDIKTAEKVIKTLQAMKNKLTGGKK